MVILVKTWRLFRFTFLTLYLDLIFNVDSIMENSEIILKTLKDNGALKSGEIAEKTGIAKNEVDKVISKLKSEELIFSPKRCFYDVKK
jgi:transcription initiation factor IIE alpha subunit